MSTNLCIEVRKNESIEDALKRLRRKMRKEGLIDQIRALDRYEKPSEKKRRKAREGKYRGKGEKSKKSPPESVARIPNSVLEEFLY